MLKQSIKQILQKEVRSQQEIYTLSEYFIQNPFFNSFTSTFPDVEPEYILYKLFELVQLQSFEKGAVIYREGETNNGEMYLIFDGVIGFSKRQKNLDDEYYLSTNMQFTKSWSNYGTIKSYLQGGQTFGEKALVSNTGQRQQTAICVSESNLVIISQEILEEIRDTLIKKKSTQDLQFVKQNDSKNDLNLLEGILDNELIRNSSRKVFKKGQLICQQDEKSRAVYFLLEGKCVVQKEILLKEQIFSKKKKKKEKRFVSSAKLINLDTLMNEGEMIGLDSILKKEIFDDINYYIQALLNYNTRNSLIQIDKWLEENSNMGKNQIKNYLRDNINASYQYSCQVVSEQANVIIIEIKNWALCFTGKKIKEYLFDFLKKVIERQFAIGLINYKNEQVLLDDDDVNLIKEVKDNLQKIMEKQQVFPSDIQDVKKIKQPSLFPQINKKLRSTSVKS